jgi:hypothetical protein
MKLFAAAVLTLLLVIGGTSPHINDLNRSPCHQRASWSIYYRIFPYTPANVIMARN